MNSLHEACYGSIDRNIELSVNEQLRKYTTAGKVFHCRDKVINKVHSVVWRAVRLQMELNLVDFLFNFKWKRK